MTISDSRRHLVAIVGLVVVCALVGCSPPVLETGSLAAIEESLIVLREPLEPETCGRFDESLAYLVDGARPADGLEDPTIEALVLEVYKPLQGSTVESILIEARAKRTAQVAAEIEKLEAARLASEEARAVLAQLHLSSGRIFKINKGFLEWPVLEFKVENSTPHTVFMVKLRAALLSPAEPGAWMVEEINHLVYQMMAPGQRDLWRIEPEQQEWIQFIDPHPNLEFSLEVMKLTTRDKKVVAQTDWGAVEAHTLKIFRNTLRTIRETRDLALDQPPRVKLPQRTS